MLTANNLKSIPYIRHGFFTREGGASTGNFTSLNTSYNTNDTIQNVAENRKRITNALEVPPNALVTVHQEATNKAVLVENNWTDGEKPIADGMATNKPELALAISTADCVPVLFADKENRIIGAAHAGWRGALSGVIENTIAKMYDLGSKTENIAVAIGPCISQKSYEVGEDLFQKFSDDDQRNEIFFKPSPYKQGHFMFDLQRYVCTRLVTAGLSRDMAVITLDTFSDKERFFSYRRATLNNETDEDGNIEYGRQLSVIAILD
ncbi:MAG: peptidoglycan editing factor PgeF [Alphaproteobacteria bacterium]|nr:peptidoglycan editing factor PgeF [Alphaproteobacteria bacterium]